MICPYCQKQAPWVSNELVYGKRHGKSYMCYWCKRCDAYVDSVYKNLSKHLGYEVHVGQSDIEQCKNIMRAVNELQRIPKPSS